MKKALSKFVGTWSKKPHVKGILLCGSYALGLQNNESDIDIRIVIDSQKLYSFKGLKEIDGYSFSYLGRNKNSIIKKFNRDYFNNSKIEARNFHLGIILYDNGGIIQNIKKIAQYYFNSPFISLFSEENSKDMMYSLYNLFFYLNKTDSKSPFFLYNYILFMRLSLMYYSKSLNLELDYNTKLERMLKDEEYIKKYNFEEFTDRVFITMWQKYIRRDNINKENAKEIFEYLKGKVYNFNDKEFLMFWKD